jgi:hypothetical protein
LQLNNPDSDQLSTFNKNPSDFSKQLITNDYSDEQMDESKNDDNENSERISYNMVESSPNRNRKSVLINHEQSLNKENMSHLTKQDLYSDNQKILDKNDFDLSQKSHRNAIKKTRVCFY